MKGFRLGIPNLKTPGSLADTGKSVENPNAAAEDV
jgi:hypothetical protein